MTSNIRIKDIPKQDRPIERLFEKGASSLGNEELLAILLKTGTHNVSVKDLALKILNRAGGIRELSKMNIDNFYQIEGMGPSKTATMMALVELASRMNQVSTSILYKKANCAELIFSYYKQKVEGKMQEYFYAIYLDSKKRIIHEKLLFMGTLNYSLVHPREIFKEAFMVSASSIICIHNHPSGCIVPSDQDQILTENLCSIGKLIGIPINDHIIIGKNTYYSFYEQGIL